MWAFRDVWPRERAAGWPSQIEGLRHPPTQILPYAHRAPLAFKAIMTIPQPTAFSALLLGPDGECPCCPRPIPDAG
jgi:hypothetical protein